ncbi:hypothetical protein SOPP22_06705 [Shewanella sp. OPT22]|nr:hypothetical protein SOPP22_06705 [Shewanella sp. OPT22]
MMLISMFTFPAQASEKKRLKWTPKVAEKPQQKPTEYSAEQQLQLKKAQQANSEIQKRELKVQQNQQRPDWESEQIKRSQKQFVDQKKRVSKQLQDAKQAAKKEKKIDKYD